MNQFAGMDVSSNDGVVTLAFVSATGTLRETPLGRVPQAGSRGIARDLQG